METFPIEVSECDRGRTFYLDFSRLRLTGVGSGDYSFPVESFHLFNEILKIDGLYIRIRSMFCHPVDKVLCARVCVVSKA